MIYPMVRILACTFLLFHEHFLIDTSIPRCTGRARARFALPCQVSVLSESIRPVIWMIFTFPTNGIITIPGARVYSGLTDFPTLAASACATGVDVMLVVLMSAS